MNPYRTLENINLMQPVSDEELEMLHAWLISSRSEVRSFAAVDDHEALLKNCTVIGLNGKIEMIDRMLVTRGLSVD